MADYSKFRISLPEEYGWSAMNTGRRQLVNVPNWKTLYPKMYERYKAIGWTDDKIGKMTEGWAGWEDWLWGTSGLPFVAPNGDIMVCGSHRMVDFHKPWSLAVTHPITEAFGRYDGFSSHPTSASGSEIDIWLEQYVDDPALRLVVPQLGTTAQKMIVGVKTTTTGKDGSAAGYTEMGQFTNWYFKGNRVGYHKQGELIVGRLGWDNGTNSSGGWWHSHGCDIPYMFVRGTPVNVVGPVTAMNCNVAGIAFVGTALNVCHFGAKVEVDDVPTGALIIPGFGREAGGTISFGGGWKIESGVSDESRGPYKGTIVGDFTGQCNLDWGPIEYHSSNVHTDSLFIADARLQNGSIQGSQMKGSLKGHGYANLIHDKLNNKVTRSPGEYIPVDFAWKEDGTVTANRTLTSFATTNKTRLGFSRWNGSAWTPTLDHATGTPAYNYQGAQGVPPVVVPPPVDPPVPPVNPPTTGTAKWSKTYTTATTTSTKVAVPAGVNPINETRLVNVKISGAGFTYINSHLFWGQGGTLWRMTATGWVDTGIKVTVGQALNVSVPMAGTTLTHCVGGAGATCVMTGTIQVL